MCVVVMAMVGWMGAGMDLVFGKHAEAGRVERCQSTFRVRGDKLMIPDHTTIQVRSRIFVVFYHAILYMCVCVSCIFFAH